MEKKEFRKIIKEIGFSSQGKFAEEIGVKATTFTTYKVIPTHIRRITRLALLAKKKWSEFRRNKKFTKSRLEKKSLIKKNYQFKPIFI